MGIITGEGARYAGPGCDSGDTHDLGAVDRYGNPSHPGPLSSEYKPRMLFFLGAFRRVAG